MNKLGDMMGDPGRDPNVNSNNPGDPGVSSIPAGYTYFGQFVDHDITLDVSSTIDVATDANTINNMRSPALDLDSVYGRGPGLDPLPERPRRLHAHTPLGRARRLHRGRPCEIRGRDTAVAVS
jgi:hypothetical protein